MKPHGSINCFALLDRELLYIGGNTDLAVFSDDVSYYLLYVTDPLAPVEFGNSNYFAKAALASASDIVPPRASTLLSVGGVPRDGFVESGHTRAMTTIWSTRVASLGFCCGISLLIVFVQRIIAVTADA